MCFWTALSGVLRIQKNPFLTPSRSVNPTFMTPSPLLFQNPVQCTIHHFQCQCQRPFLLSPFPPGPEKPNSKSPLSLLTTRIYCRGEYVKKKEPALSSPNFAPSIASLRFPKRKGGKTLLIATGKSDLRGSAVAVVITAQLLLLG